MWDAETFACLEVIPGTDNLATIAGGARLFPWRAIARDLETVIEDAATGRVFRNTTKLKIEVGPFDDCGGTFS